MITKTKLLSRSIALRPLATTPPWTTEQRLQRIDVMAQRIVGYVQFMCQASNLSNTSPETREKAVAAFYEQMHALESQLGRIHDIFKLE